MTSPSKSQQAAIDAITAWVDTNEPHFILRAGAGRGKSWVVLNHILPLFRAYTRNAGFMGCHLVATTNQACDSLKKMVSTEVITFHSMLGLRPNKAPNPRNPKQFVNLPYTMGQTIPNNTKGLLIIDEAYRLEQDLLDVLAYLMPNYRILFVGDPFQTPPVGFSTSPLENHPASKSTLVEPMRFGYSPLGELVDNLMLAVEFEEDGYHDLLPKENDEGIHLIKRRQLQPVLNELIFSQQPILYTQTCVLSATREIADSFNNYIISTRAKHKHPIIRKGESVVLDTYIGPSDNPLAHFFRTSATIPITELDHNNHLEAKNHIVKMIRSFGLTPAIKDRLIKQYTPVMHDSSDIVFLLTGDKGKGLNGKQMKELWQLQRQTGLSFHFIRLGIAKTIHMSQGITSENVYLDMTSIAKWREPDMQRRLYYTGISRCSKHLYLMS